MAMIPRAGSFIRLSKILDSPTWTTTEPVTLNELWNSLPEGAQRPLAASPDPIGPLKLGVGALWLDGQTPEPVEVVVSDIPESVAAAIPLPSGTSPELDQFLVPYPSLAGYVSAARDF